MMHLSVMFDIPMTGTPPMQGKGLKHDHNHLATQQNVLNVLPSQSLIWDAH
jgi:hypothetical protein